MFNFVPFIGTHTSLIAPITVGKNAFTAAGSTVTENVPDNALAIARVRQINKLNYAEKIRNKHRNVASSEHNNNDNDLELSPEKQSFIGAIKTTNDIIHQSDEQEAITFMIQFIHTADIHFGMENYGKINPQTGIHSRLWDFYNALLELYFESKPELKTRKDCLIEKTLALTQESDQLSEN